MGREKETINLIDSFPARNHLPRQHFFSSSKAFKKANFFSSTQARAKAGHGSIQK